MASATTQTSESGSGSWLRFIRWAHISTALLWLRRHWKMVLLVLVIVLPVGALANFLLSEPQPEYITDVVKRGELVQTVEAVGTIISEKDLELKFPVSGIVSEVFVDEGDAVEAGQVLAELRGASLGAAVTSARAKLTTASAEYRELREGTRPEDIAIAEAELRNKQASLDLARAKYDTAQASLERAEVKLESLRRESEIALAGEVSIASSSITKELSVAETALGKVEDVFRDRPLQVVVNRTFTQASAKLELDILDLYPQIDTALSQSRDLTDYRQATASVSSARQLALQASRIVQDAYDFVAQLDPAGSFSFSKRETLKGTLATEKTNVQKALNNLDTSLRALQDKSANFETKIATEQSALVTAQGSRDQADVDIQTFQTSVQIAQANLDLKRAGSRQSDIDAAYGRVQQAQADLEKAEADYDDTFLRAPINGVITKVNLKAGEFTPGQFSETQAAMTILGDSPYRLELFAAEIDIPKVVLQQSGSALLDAFPGRPFDVVVSEIDPAATIVDGVPKYRVVLDFAAPATNFKIGMTGDTDIVTDIKPDVLYVPARAVVKDEDENDVVRILVNRDLEDRPVTTGLETITDIEIVTGVAEDDEVVVLIKTK